MDSQMQGRLIHSTEMSVVQFQSEGVWAESDDLVIKKAAAHIRSVEFLNREDIVLSDLGGEVGPEIVSRECHNDGSLDYLVMKRIGTHDLSDVMHDLAANDIALIVSNLVKDVAKLHSLGYVHRDIKPGNIMLKKDVLTGRNSKYAGLVDFGLTMRINRKQTEKTALAGTEPYGHPTQMSQEMKEIRVHPAQDWFAVARTIFHILVGGSHETFKANVLSPDVLKRAIKQLNDCFDGVDYSAISDLLKYSIKPEASKSQSFEKFLELSESIINMFDLMNETEKRILNPSKNDDTGIQYFSNSRPKRHDVLLIIDGTGSMSDQIENLKISFGEVFSEYGNDIDLRVDVWNMGDYSRDGSSEGVVIPIGERLVAKSIRDVIPLIDANRIQHDEAEAYEQALQYAYHKSSLQRRRWSPRENSTRTVVLVGDSYAHGWLKKHSPWGKVIVKARGKWNKESGTRSAADPSVKKLYNDFERRHKHYMGYSIEKAEKEAYTKAFLQLKNKDQFGGKGSVDIPGEQFKQRPNFETAIDRLREMRATVHAISAGENLLSHNFMKYVAYRGNGSYTHLEKNELKDALAGILLLADPNAFQRLRSNVENNSPDTQVLTSMTTWVNDSTD